MPLQVKKVQMKLKDGQQFVDGDLLFNVDAQAWARGQRNGQDVANSDPTYHDNAKYYKQQAANSAVAAADAALTGNLAPAFVTNVAYSAGDYVIYNDGSTKTLYQFTQNHAAGVWIGTDAEAVTVGQTLEDFDTTITNTLSDFDDAIDTFAGDIAAAYDPTGTYQVGDYCTYQYQLYKCNTAITSPQATFVAAHWTQVNISNSLNEDVGNLKEAINMAEIIDSKNGTDITITNGVYEMGFVGLTQTLPYSDTAYTSTAININYHNILADIKPSDAIHGTFKSNSTIISSATNAWVWSIPCKPNTDYKAYQTSPIPWAWCFGDEPIRVGASVYDPVAMTSRTSYTMNSGTHTYLYFQVSSTESFNNLISNHSAISYFSPYTYTKYKKPIYFIQSLPSDFYGGDIDYIAGTITSKYDSSGNVLANPVVTDFTIFTNEIKELPVNIWGDGDITASLYLATKEYIDGKVTDLSDDIAALEGVVDTINDTLTFDNAPIYNSTKLVKSGGIYNADAAKLNKPLADGTVGQILSNSGNGQTEWVNAASPTTEQVNSAVNSYLELNPPAAVPQGSLNKVNFSNILQIETVKEFVTPEMYNAVGDGTTDDTTAVQNAINSGKAVKCYKTYLVSEIDITDCDFEIIGTIIGQVNIHNNSRVYGGTIQQNSDNPCVKFSSTLNDHKGYMNSYLMNCILHPNSDGIGIQLYADSNALFGVFVKDIDIASCNKSIHIYNNRWITKSDFENIYCHTPTYAIFIENLRTTNTYCADLTFRNVYAQYYNEKPINFVKLDSGNCLVTMYECFCYDGIKEYHFNIPNDSTETRFTLLGPIKNAIDTDKFTSYGNLRHFYFTNNHATDSQYIKMSARKNLPIDYMGNLYFENMNSPGLSESRFFGIVGRGGSNEGASGPNKVFGISCYDGRLSLLRSTDGTINNGSVYEVTTPYSGAVYTTSTLPTNVMDGAKCWCSDIHMDVTYYNGVWYKPDGTAIS